MYMTILKSQFTVRRAFVTNELFIVLGLLAVGILGAVILTRTLHLGWLGSAAVVTVAIIAILVGLSFLFTPRKRQ
jgi:hypothetical protein